MFRSEPHRKNVAERAVLVEPRFATENAFAVVPQDFETMVSHHGNPGGHDHLLDSGTCLPVDQNTSLQMTRQRAPAPCGHSVRTERCIVPYVGDLSRCDRCRSATP